MEKQLKCVLLLPLKEMALRKVAVLLWSGSDVLASISKFRFQRVIINNRRIDWRESIEDKIKDKVWKLELPESLAKKMIDLVRPIGFEIRRWKKFHEERYRSLEIVLGLTKLCWITVGRIDDRRTAEELVRCEGVSVVQRYEIACDYCLEDCIPLLWEELSEEKKKYFYEERFSFSLDLQFHWPYILKGEQSNLDYLLKSADRNLTSFNQCAFEQSAKNGYKSAAVHFFQKLTHEEREASLITSAHALLAHIELEILDDEMTCDVLCYLLSLMTPEEQRRFIEAHPIQVLLIFFHWPLQDLFLENSSLIWTFIPPSGYGDLLSRMVDRFQESELYFPKLFQEFFLQSPLDFKKFFVPQETGLDITPAHLFLSIFIAYEDSESLEVIFRNVETADRLKLVFHPEAFNSFFKGILMGKWPMVEVCLREAALSDEDKLRLKVAFTGFLDRTVNGEFVNRKFKRFFKFLDEAYASSDKEKKSRKH